MVGLIRTEDAAELLGLSPATLHHWRSRGEGPQFVKLGGAVRYRAEDLEKWVVSRIVKPERESGHAKELKGEERFLKKRGESG